MSGQDTSSAFFPSLGRITAGVLVGILVIIVGLWAFFEFSEKPAVHSAFAPQPAETAQAQTLASDTIMVNEKQFNTTSFVLNRNANVTVSVRLKQGPAIDVYLVDEHGLNAWEAMSLNRQTSISFPYYRALSMAPLAEGYMATAYLAAGRYALIIDNSWAGATHPPFHILPHNYSVLVEYSIAAGGD